MSVIVTKGGGLGSVLGPLATIGGMATGNPWLMAAGAGINAMSGNGGGAGTLGSVLNGMVKDWPGWTNPGAGSMVDGYDAGTAPWMKVFKEQQEREWKGDGAWLR